MQHSQCGQALLALDGTILLANPAFRKLCDISSVSVSERHLQESLTRGGSIFYESQFLPTLLQRGRIREISLELVSSTGEQTPVFVSAVLRRTEEGKPSGMFVAVFDATHRRLYEKELLRARREAEQTSEIVRRSSDAILRLDPHGVIQSWNYGASQIFGWPSDEAIGKTLDLILAEPESKELHQALGVLHGGIDVFRELIGCRRDGSALDIAVSLTPHFEAPGILVAFSAIIRDITSRKLAERALIQTEKLASVGRLASSIAHEINNPLESVTNLLYILQSRPLDSESLSLIVTAQEELARVSQIAIQTLRFHKQSSRQTYLDISALADSVLGLYRNRFLQAGVTVVSDSKTTSPLLCFEGEIRQILVNLIANAYDAMRSGGLLTLRSRNLTIWPSGVRGVRVTVADTGRGMDKSTLDRVFEPFFTTKGINGTGLGLWITQELVHKHHGIIKIRSNTTPAKHGTVITLVFPHSETGIPQPQV